jgi:nucleoside-diphosphate-sugar epimerase
MKVLFIGGTGIISSACTKLAVEQGIDLYLLNRGRSIRPVPQGVHVLGGDIRDPASAQAALGSHRFDAVVDWIAFTPEHVELDLELFRRRTAQYVFISSASAYQKPPRRVPITESTPLANPFWAYSRAKIACEERLARASSDEGFPVTVVRPSHTYDATAIPAHGGWALVERMRRGERIVVHGDGTSLWTLTHHRDFARGFNGLLGLDAAIGEAFQITSDEALTWDTIHHILARAAGTEAKIVHVPSEAIAAVDSSWGDSLLGDKMHCAIFDNTKIKRYVPGYEATIPFSRGAEEIVAWYDAQADRRVAGGEVDAVMDRLLAQYDALLWRA